MSKRKGFGFEREVVKQAQDMGFEAERMWGSDGRSAGLPSEVDVIINGLTFQLKRRKTISEYMKPAKGIVGQIVRADREEAYIVIRLSTFLKMLKKLRSWNVFDV